MNPFCYTKEKKLFRIEDEYEFFVKCNHYFNQYFPLRMCNYVYDVFASEKDFNECIVYPFKLYQFFGCATVIDGLYVLNAPDSTNIYKNAQEYLRKKYSK